MPGTAKDPQPGARLFVGEKITNFAKKRPGALSNNWVRTSDNKRILDLFEQEFDRGGTGGSAFLSMLNARMIRNRMKAMSRKLTGTVIKLPRLVTAPCFLPRHTLPN